MVLDGQTNRQPLGQWLHPRDDWTGDEKTPISCIVEHHDHTWETVAVIFNT